MMRKRIFGISCFLFFLTAAHAEPVSFTDKNQIEPWAAPAVYKLVEIGVLSGNDDGSFAPQRSVNRAEFCKILVNATGVKKYVPLRPHFSDIERDDWFFVYVETAKHYGWLDGYPDGTFRPGNKINRAEVAKILVNAFDLNIPKTPVSAPWFEKYFRAMMGFDLFAYGCSWENLNPEVFPSRSEISEQLLRFLLTNGKMSLFELENLLQTGVETIYEKENNPLGPDPGSEEQGSEASKAPKVDMFEYQPEEPPFVKSKISIKSSAGSLNVAKSGSLKKKNTVTPGQKNITAHILKFSSKGGHVELGAIQLRRVGSGKISNFASVWAQSDGKPVSEKITPSEDLVTLSFKKNFQITASEKIITIKVDMAENAGYGSSRFVLFLPEWIDADTKKKIGFFPIGGADIIIPDPNE